MAMKTISDVVNHRLCISCGACAGVSSRRAIDMTEHVSQGMILPEIRDPRACSGGGLEFDVCPGKGYPIMALSREWFPEAPHRDLDLGAWHAATAARSADKRLLANAASGGVMTGIAAHLLETGRVQGVVVSKPSYGAPGPRNQTYIAHSVEDLIASQGSKYCPVPAMSILPEIERHSGPVAYVGTPCQIAALRMYQEARPEMKDQVPFVIGNYCGGFRDLRETDTLIRRSGFRPEDVVAFRYRGDGQPGSMRIEDRSGRVVILPYPEYAQRTGFIKQKRCRFCVDATAELADFACGDAWIPRLLESGEPWSLVMTRSRAAQAVFEEMIERGKLDLAEVSIEEIKKSQYDNLRSKKTRQDARRRFYRPLGVTMPEFDGGYPESASSLTLEFKVFLRHTLFGLAERLGLFPLLAKALGRY
jgi:coenzyme F420 hydrogenase subunit beta